MHLIFSSEKETTFVNKVQQSQRKAQHFARKMCTINRFNAMHSFSTTNSTFRQIFFRFMNRINNNIFEAIMKDSKIQMRIQLAID